MYAHVRGSSDPPLKNPNPNQNQNIQEMDSSQYFRLEERNEWRLSQNDFLNKRLLEAYLKGLNVSQSDTTTNEQKIVQDENIDYWQ